MPAPLRSILGIAALLATAAPAAAADLFGTGYEPAAEPAGAETVVIEPFVGYLRGTSGEYVYDVANGNAKLSQLDWRVDALAVGARVAARPLDWLTVRGRAWGTVASGGSMTDYDWFAGYFGPNSWTHKSESPDTKLGKAWQADASVAVKFYEDDDLALTAIAGYRHYNVKYNARGGSYIYSSGPGFRDLYGSFPAGQLGISYEQLWRTPYIGLGAVYNSADWTVSAEAIGSPFVMGRARDYHALRYTLFKDDFEMSTMLGVNLGAEYRLSPVVSLAGRLEYQNYLEARGGVKLFNGQTGVAQAAPKPTGGGDAETLLLSLGVKARL